MRDFDWFNLLCVICYARVCALRFTPVKMSVFNSLVDVMEFTRFFFEIRIARYNTNDEKSRGWALKSVTTTPPSILDRTPLLALSARGRVGYRWRHIRQYPPVLDWPDLARTGQCLRRRYWKIQWSVWCCRTAARRRRGREVVVDRRVYRSTLPPLRDRRGRVFLFFPRSILPTASNRVVTTYWGSCCENCSASACRACGAHDTQQ